jgi:hydrogenase maturation protease
MTSTLVLGLGNPILTDDGVGILIVREVQSQLLSRTEPAGEAKPGICFAEASVGGFRLLEVLAGHDRAILVDAIQTPGGTPGAIHRLQVSDLSSSLHSGSTHDLTLAGALALGRALGMALPTDEAMEIIAVEVDDVLTFGEGCTPSVEAAIPEAVQLVLELA